MGKNKKSVNKAIKHEKEQWDLIFESKLKNVSKKPRFSNFWDEDYYKQIKNICVFVHTNLSIRAKF